MLQSALTLFLTGQPELEAAHWELYPERVGENIPLSLTLLYPYATPDESAQHFGTLRDFFGSRRPLSFDLVGIAEFPEAGIYAVPEPDDGLRATTGRYGRAGCRRLRSADAGTSRSSSYGAATVQTPLAYESAPVIGAYMPTPTDGETELYGESVEYP